MNSILFENHHLYYLPQFRPIIDELKRRGGYSIAASMPESINRPERETFYQAITGLGIELIRSETEEERVKTLASRAFDVVIVGNVGQLHEIVAPTSLAVMVYHGIGLKASYFKDFSPRIDLLAVESRDRAALWKQIGVDQTVVVGLTKLDPLINDDNSRAETLIKLGLDPAKPTVLYAPTFYPSSIPKAFPGLVALAGDVNVVIKLHNFSWFQKRYRFQSAAAIELSKIGGIALAPADAYDILPYYRASDALITDISSTLFEYLALDRPIIRTTFRSLRLKHRLFPWRIKKRLDNDRMAQIDFATTVGSPKDLATVTMAQLANRDELAAERRTAAQTHLHAADGQASSRLVDAIETALDDRSR